jgi:hypothetical protein
MKRKIVSLTYAPGETLKSGGYLSPAIYVVADDGTAWVASADDNSCWKRIGDLPDRPDRKEVPMMPHHSAALIERLARAACRASGSNPDSFGDGQIRGAYGHPRPSYAPDGVQRPWHGFVAAAEMFLAMMEAALCTRP